MNNQKARACEIQESIRNILLKTWDPLGVSDEPIAKDEYDSYIGPIYRLLASGGNVREVASLLAHIESQNMGLHGDRNIESLLPTAKQLVDLTIVL